MQQPSSPEMSRAVRIAFGTVMGVVFGIFVVKLLDRVGVGDFGDRLTFAGRMWILLSEAVVGFGIAVSGLRMPWLLHGSMLGLVFSIPMSIWMLRVYGIAVPTAPYAVRIFFLMLFLGVVFGILIELVLSAILKVKSYYTEPAAAITETKPR
jgi:hypothetical protein